MSGLCILNRIIPQFFSTGGILPQTLFAPVKQVMKDFSSQQSGRLTTWLPTQQLPTATLKLLLSPIRCCLSVKIVPKSLQKAFAAFLNGQTKTEGGEDWMERGLSLLFLTDDKALHCNVKTDT